MRAQHGHVLAIIGQGYVGLPLAMAAVDAGWTVIGVDNFEAKVAQINSGSSPVEDISDLKLQSALASGAYRATDDFSSVTEASVITICVPTPLNEKREPDLDLLKSAATGISPYVSDEALVVSESTSYPGTLREIIIPIVNSLKPTNSKRVYFASAPERLIPATQHGIRKIHRGLLEQLMQSQKNERSHSMNLYVMQPFQFQPLRLQRPLSFLKILFV